MIVLKIFMWKDLRLRKRKRKRKRRMKKNYH